MTPIAALVALMGAGCGAPPTPHALPTPPKATAIVAPPCVPVAQEAFSVSSDVPSYFEASVDVGEDGNGYALFTTQSVGDQALSATRIVGRAFDLRSRTLGPVSIIDERGAGLPQVVAGKGRFALAWLSGGTKGRVVKANGQLGPVLTLGPEERGVLARSGNGFSLTSVTTNRDACELRRSLLDASLVPKGEPETLSRLAQSNFQCLHAAAVADHTTAKGHFSVYRTEDFKTLVRLPTGQTREVPEAGSFTSLEVQDRVLSAWLSGSAQAQTLHVGWLGEPELARTAVPADWRGWQMAIAALGTDAVVVDERLQGRLLRGRELGAPVPLAHEGTNPHALSGDLLAWTSNLRDRSEFVIAKLTCTALPGPSAIVMPLAQEATPAPADAPAACRLRLDKEVTLTGKGAKAMDRSQAPSLSVAEGTVWVAWSDFVSTGKPRLSMNIERYDAATGKPLGSRIPFEPGTGIDVAPVILGTTRSTAELVSTTWGGTSQLPQWTSRAVDSTHAGPATALFDPLARITRPTLALDAKPLLLWHGGDGGALRVRRLSQGASTLTLAEWGTSGPIRALAYQGDFIVAWRGELASSLSDIGRGISFARITFDGNQDPRIVWRGSAHPDLVIGDLGELVVLRDHDVILPLPHLTDDASLFARVSLDGAIEPDLVVPARGFAAAADDSGVAVIDAGARQFCVKLFDHEARPRGEPACFATRTSFVGGAISARWVGQDLWLASTEAPDEPARGGSPNLPADIVRLRRLVCAK
ncbi:MAG: hypothetical protein HY898_17760 [Deltaproteobacteria bacterium]|nr:hypothetical protein [Deltaproteobacteria bacterium]